MRRPWLKFYPADWRADPRLRLCSLAARGLWIELISYMHEGEPYGHLTIDNMKPSIGDIAALVACSKNDVIKLLAELERRQVYSRTDQGVIYSRRMVRDNQKAIRDSENGKGGGNPDLLKGVNPHVNPNTITPDKAQKLEARDQSPEKKETRASALGSDWPPDFAEQFWGAFPNKVGRKAAIDKLERIGKTRRVSFEELMAGLHGYVTKTDDRPWCNPLTWLNQERWTDQPAAQNGVKNGHIHQNGSLIEAADQLVERARQRLAEARGEGHVFDAESPVAVRPISPGRGE